MKRFPVTITLSVHTYVNLNRVMNKYDLEVKLTAVNPIATQPVQTNQERVTISGDGLSLIRFGSMIVLVTSILMLAKAWKVVRAKNVTFDSAIPNSKFDGSESLTPRELNNF
jgi:hypothetical protein